MSGSDSYIRNADVSVPQHAPPPTANVIYAPPPIADVIYAPPPLAVQIAAPNSSEPPATYQPDTGVSGGSEVEAVVQLPSGNNTGEVIKRKRGRPRKNPPPEGSSDLTSPPPPVQSGRFDAAQVSSGKAPGSGRKKEKKVVPPAVLGSAETGLTPHVITVKPGEDVLVKVMSVFQNTTKSVCVLSANGVISHVILRRPTTSVTIEGRFDIVSLSGSLLLFESGGQRRMSGGLTVSLAGPDGHILGGVAGLLTAASAIQVVVTSFIPEDQQATYLGNREVYPALPNLASGASMVGIPSSRATLSGSSGGPGSPLNYSTGGFNNSNPQTFANIGWR